MQSNPLISALSIEKLDCRIKDMQGTGLIVLANMTKMELKLIAWLLGSAFQTFALNPLFRTSAVRSWAACSKFVNFHKKVKGGWGI